MKIKILGTAAAEGWPAIFCNCETCQKVRELGGKDIRSRSSVIFDDTVLIDGSYDNFMHSIMEGVDFYKIKDVFITHEHSDHFIYDDYYPFFFYEDLSLYANELAIKDLLTYPEKPETWTGINVIKPFESVVTKDGHKITSVKAEHNPDQVNQLNYIIEFQGKCVPWLTDTGLYEDEKTWEFLSQFKFDTIISECTCWRDEKPFYHQTFEGVLKARERFLKMGCIKEDTPYYLTHFSHNIKMLHNEMVDIAKPYGIEICYDGLEIIV